MGETHAYITVTLDLVDPVELNDFVKMFAGLGDEFEGYLRTQYPSISGKAKFFVKEIRSGSIIVDLIPTIKDMIGMMNNINVVVDFGNLVGSIISKYISGRKPDDINKDEINKLFELLGAVANNREGYGQIDTITYIDGERKKYVNAKFTVSEARAAIRTLEEHKLDLDKTEAADHSHVLMIFEMSGVKDTKTGKKSKELAVIEKISKKALPIVYASDLAQEKIRSINTESYENIFKKAFDVDVNVETKNGKPIAYRITHVHDVIDVPDE